MARASVGINYEKLCDDGKNIIPATSHKIAPKRNK